MGTTISKILLFLRIINCAILFLLLIRELFYNIVILTMTALDGADAPADTIGTTLALFLPFPCFYALLVLFTYRIKNIISPSQGLPMFKISFFTGKIAHIYPSPAPLYYFIIIFNIICIAYFWIIFVPAEGDLPLWSEFFITLPMTLLVIALPLCRFTFLAVFYDTQFISRNVFYAFLLNILYLMGGLFIIAYIYCLSFRTFILYEVLDVP